MASPKALRGVSASKARSLPRFVVDEREGRDLVIDSLSSEILWLYVRLFVRDCEAILAMW